MGHLGVAIEGSRFSLHELERILSENDELKKLAHAPEPPERISGPGSLARLERELAAMRVRLSEKEQLCLKVNVHTKRHSDRESALENRHCGIQFVSEASYCKCTAGATSAP